MYEKNRQEKDPFWITSMRTLKIRKMVIEVEEKLPSIIDEWYREQGLDTPVWRQPKPYFDSEGNIIRPE